MTYSEEQQRQQLQAIQPVISAVGDLEGRIGDPQVNEYADELRRLVMELLTHFDLEDN